jgi:hypothetical protein
MSALPLIAGLETGKTVSDECVHVIRYDADGKLMVFQAFEGTAAAVAQLKPTACRLTHRPLSPKHAGFRSFGAAPMSPIGRYCCKSRKLNDAENLANVDF